MIPTKITVGVLCQAGSGLLQLHTEFSAIRVELEYTGREVL